MTVNTPTNKKANKKLKLIKTLWGIDEPISSKLFQSIKDEGYSGVEVIRLAYAFDKGELLIKSLNDAGLCVVCQIHTTGGYLDKDTGEYVYCGKYDVKSHQDDFDIQLKECAELIGRVKEGGFINVHAGVDAWTNVEAIEFLEYCMTTIEQEKVGCNVTFETHRQRLFGNPFQTRELLSLLSPRCNNNLKLNCDLSHWYCACERVFNSDKEDRDSIWWPELLSTISKRCGYIHARLGHSQGPQIPDPSAKEYDNEVQLQLNIWKILIKEQLKKRDDGRATSIYVSPEYGPTPYMITKPHTKEPISSLSNAVLYTKKLIEDMFESIIEC